MDYELMMNGNVKIGMQAPDFEAESTYGKISLNDYRGKWVILFSHPGDFTPVKLASLDEINRTKKYYYLKNKIENISDNSNETKDEIIKTIEEYVEVIDFKR